MLMLLVLSVVAVAAEHLPEAEYRELFRQTRIKYRLPSLSAGAHPSPEVEKQHFLVFKQHVDEINEHNHQKDLEFKMGINEFTLETAEELKQHLGVNITRHRAAKLLENTLTFNKRDIENIERRMDNVDYSHKLPRIKDQGGCGSCWTFGALAALEYQVNKDRMGPLKSLSEQQFLDCTYKRDGCAGGWPDDCYTWSYLHGSHVASTANYPYTARYETCRYNKVRTRSQNALSGWSIGRGAKYIAGDGNMLAAVADDRKGVMSVAIAVVGDFYGYESGVYSSTKCNVNVDINHAVDVVGYGVLDGVPFWRVRNSWGDWGDNGYINMKRGVKGNDLNMCHISEFAHYPTVTGQDDGKGDDDEEEEEEEEEDEEGDDEWCVSQDKKLIGYAAGERVALADLDQAKSACGSRSDCGGITTEGAKFTLRAGTRLVTKVGAVSYTVGSCQQDCRWVKVQNRKFRGSLSPLNMKIGKAKTKCLAKEGCVGITCKDTKCRMVSKTNGSKNANFVGHKYICPE